MAESAMPPEQMSREELENEVSELRTRLDDLESDIEAVSQSSVNETVLNHIIQALAKGDIDFTDDPMQHVGLMQDLGDRINDIEKQLQKHESLIEEGQAVATDRQGGHWQNVVEAAQNLKNDHRHSLTDGWVQLYKEDIQTATGLSDRRAGQLIDEWTNKDGDKHKNATRKQDYKPPSAGNNGSVQKKALKIDLDVWGDADE